MKPVLALVACLLLTSCAAPPPLRDDGWVAVALPGKTPTRYDAMHKDGRSAVAAFADRSASLWRRPVAAALPAPVAVRFSWWVDDMVPGASVVDVEREDAAARVLFAFDGDHTSLSPRNRMLFDLAQALTGERPPYATLMYVYANEVPVGSLVRNPRTDRIRKIVLDSGPGELRRWRDHRRDLAADFRHAFGEEPGTLLSVALMTDTDNTGTRARTWYGPVLLD